MPVSFGRGGYGSKRGFDKASAWWKLPPEMKDLLQIKREEGKFGGGSAAGIGHAPYFWIQEFGTPKAMVRPQRYITGPTGYFMQFIPKFFRLAME